MIPAASRGEGENNHMKRRNEWAAALAVALGATLIIGVAGMLLHAGEPVDSGTGMQMPATGEIGVVIIAVVFAVLVVAGIVVRVMADRKAKRIAGEETEEEGQPAEALVTSFDNTAASREEAAAKADKGAPAEAAQPVDAVPTSTLKPASDGVEPPTLQETGSVTFEQRQAAETKPTEKTTAPLPPATPAPKPTTSAPTPKTTGTTGHTGPQKPADKPADNTPKE